LPLHCSLWAFQSPYNGAFDFNNSLAYSSARNFTPILQGYAGSRMYPSGSLPLFRNHSGVTA